ncbi:hypothetical protein [Halobacterium sp. BOL4-2]|uniref:hypothetical protein n=1 Tax=Halobacterium sp. BOL4-2 TaxID=2810537 RepID=UPI0019634939|nr:hypothetical protein [Halobacterium sp. BOL4-2]QRY26390.1 hypothetical protein JRZ79_13145 [Halobacterium sp. BOL4-2]
MKSVYDPSTEFEIARSETPISEDGYKIGEPKYLECAYCSARVLLTEEPSPGIDELQHDPFCGQRFARTTWWQEHFTAGSPSA